MLTLASKLMATQTLANVFTVKYTFYLVKCNPFQLVFIALSLNLTPKPKVKGSVENTFLVVTLIFKTAGVIAQEGEH